MNTPQYGLKCPASDSQVTALQKQHIIIGQHVMSNNWSKELYLEQISQCVHSTHLKLSAGAGLHDALEHAASLRAK